MKDAPLTVGLLGASVPDNLVGSPQQHLVHLQVLEIERRILEIEKYIGKPALSPAARKILGR